MGHGSCSSHRWQPDRKLTPQQEIAYWQSRAMQYKAENEHLSNAVERLDRTNERLAKQISDTNRLLAEYRQSFGSIGFPSER